MPIASRCYLAGGSCCLSDSRQAAVGSSCITSSIRNKLGAQHCTLLRQILGPCTYDEDHAEHAHDSREGNLYKGPVVINLPAPSTRWLDSPYAVVGNCCLQNCSDKCCTNMSIQRCYSLYLPVFCCHERSVDREHSPMSIHTHPHKLP